MKKRSLIKSLTAILLLIGCSDVDNPESNNNDIANLEKVTDQRDGKVYRIVTIGTQTWMAENLNFWTNNSWCYLGEFSNCEKYGHLYTWDAATTACPSGWHLPTDEEWKLLEIEIGMSKVQANELGSRGVNEGYKLKSKNGWRSGGGGSDQYGFGGLPASQRNSGGSYGIDSIHSFWWTASKDSNKIDAYYRATSYYESTITRKTQSTGIGNSVRCIRD